MSQVALINLFKFVEVKSSCRYVLVCATHLKAKKGFEEDRFSQMQVILGILCDIYCRLDELVVGMEANYSVSVVIVGDFNAEPEEKACSIVKSCGFHSAYSTDWNSFAYPGGPFIANNASSSVDQCESEPRYTTWKKRYKGEVAQESCVCIDYIFVLDQPVLFVKNAPSGYSLRGESSSGNVQRDEKLVENVTSHANEIHVAGLLSIPPGRRDSFGASPKRVLSLRTTLQ